LRSSRVRFARLSWSVVGNRAARCKLPTKRSLLAACLSGLGGGWRWVALGWSDRAEARPVPASPRSKEEEEEEKEEEVNVDMPHRYHLLACVFELYVVGRDGERVRRGCGWSRGESDRVFGV